MHPRHADQVLLELFVVDVERGGLEERTTFEGSAQTKTRHHRVDADL